MFIARMETGHFTFEAAGLRDATAKVALRDGFRRHLKSYIASYSGSGTDLSEMEKGLTMSVAELDEYYGIQVTSFKQGQCRRDGTEI
jgi:hypothetical protein